MEATPKKSITSRIGSAEPIISLGYRVYDFASAYWPQIIASLGAGSIMSTLAALTDWVKAYGSVVVGAIGLVASLITWVVLQLGLLLTAKKRLAVSQNNAVVEWAKENDNVNPLSNEFHTKRLNINQIANPLIIGLKARDL